MYFKTLLGITKQLHIDFVKLNFIKYQSYLGLFVVKKVNREVSSEFFLNDHEKILDVLTIWEKEKSRHIKENQNPLLDFKIFLKFRNLHRLVIVDNGSL